MFRSFYYFLTQTKEVGDNIPKFVIILSQTEISFGFTMIFDS